MLTIKQKKSGETVEVSIPICAQLRDPFDEVQARQIGQPPLNQYGEAR